jgi:hypothetical protein
VFRANILTRLVWHHSDVRLEVLVCDLGVWHSVEAKLLISSELINARAHVSTHVEARLELLELTTVGARLLLSWLRLEVSLSLSIQQV